MTETTKTETVLFDSTSSTSISTSTSTSTSTAPSTSTSTSTSTSASTSSTSTSLSSPSPSPSASLSSPSSTSTSIAASSSPHPHVLSSTSASFVPALSPASSTTSIPKNIPPGEHALETPWTFYFDKKLITPAPGSTGPTHVEYKNYEQNLQKLGTVHTVEQFWKHFSHMTSPDELPKDHNVYFFRNQAIPAWETFPNGGCWILKVRKRNGVINRLWEELCFAMIGEWFGEPGIAGIGLSSRARDDNISVWNVDNHIPEVRFNIGEKLKEILNLDESTQIEYKFFRSAIAEGSTFRNAKAYVYAAQAAYLPVTHA